MTKARPGGATAARTHCSESRVKPERDHPPSLLVTCIASVLRRVGAGSDGPITATYARNRRLISFFHVFFLKIKT